ncbi:RING/U-box superfamily protein [Quillaja saponaria]|uniref:RING/U-box superfamily protein n=1 Tax=Quillaja saponaria TaxID=32244 RepID=A0AAD7PGA3_QUISA|nr:RING/U-box superfamily protein [Quillaja saponaria]
MKLFVSNFYLLDPSLGRISFTPTKEGTFENPDSGGSTLSRSHSSESEPTLKSYLSSQRNFSSRHSFISKPIHPLSFTDETPSGEAFDTSVAGFSEFGAVTQLRDAQCWSNASSNFDFRDTSESFGIEISGCSHPPSVGFRCGLCERFLSQRSPWSSRRIVRCGDLPITGVLSCCHVFHAECLEQTTSKTRKNDPPCPLCVKSDEENSIDQRGFMKSRNGFPKLRPHCDDGSSRPWGCSQASDCVEGGLHSPPRNAMLLLNRSRIKKNLSLKGNLSKGFPGKLKKSESYSSQLFIGKSIDQGAVECSKGTAGPSMRQ